MLDHSLILSDPHSPGSQEEGPRTDCDYFDGEWMYDSSLTRARYFPVCVSGEGPDSRL